MHEKATLRKHLEAWRALDDGKHARHAKQFAHAEPTLAEILVCERHSLLRRTADLIGNRLARGGKREGAGRKKGSKDKRPRSSPVIIAPAQEERELREAAREFTDAALKTLAAICKKGQSEAARVSAASALLDRGYGKPVQHVDVGVTHYDRMDEDQLREHIEAQTLDIQRLERPPDDDSTEH